MMLIKLIANNLKLVIYLLTIFINKYNKLRNYNLLFFFCLLAYIDQSRFRLYMDICNFYISTITSFNFSLLLANINKEDQFL